MTIHVFLAFPETRGKTLEEVEEVFASNLPAWKTHALKTTHLEDIVQDISDKQKNSVPHQHSKGSSMTPESEKDTEIA